METSATIQGPSYTQGTSYRARAERRQREFRAQELRVSHGTYGHFLAASAAKDGSNFVVREAFEAARARTPGGGVSVWRKPLAALGELRPRS